VNGAPGLLKSYGERVPKCGTYQVSGELREVAMPLLREIESLSERIKEYDERMEKIAKEVYPEVSLLMQVKGVGTQIALTYVRHWATRWALHHFRCSCTVLVCTCQNLAPGIVSTAPSRLAISYTTAGLATAPTPMEKKAILHNSGAM